VKIFRQAVFDGIKRPQGPEEIIEIFGDIGRYVHAGRDGKPRLYTRFEYDHITTVRLPAPIPLAGRPGQFADKVRCHRLLAPKFEAILKEMAAGNLQSQLQSFGGCFCFRPKRRGGGYSTHSWGIAIDLNPETNLPGTPGHMNDSLVWLFKNHGFIWGGDWKGKSKDPMHFQYCTGY
jgi:hypothetical protein